LIILHLEREYNGESEKGKEPLQLELESFKGVDLSNVELVLTVQFTAILSIKTGSDVYYAVIEELPTDYQNKVTTVICRKIRPGHEKDYNDWVRRYLTLERKAPGYLGTTIIIPGSSKSPLWYIILCYLEEA
jgi:hypothetical protein